MCIQYIDIYIHNATMYQKHIYSIHTYINICIVYNHIYIHYVMGYIREQYDTWVSLNNLLLVWHLTNFFAGTVGTMINTWYLMAQV